MSTQEQNCCGKIDSSYDAPIECYGIGAQWVNGFTQDGIINALKQRLMEHLDILYDHYKDTVVLMKDAQRDRDRFFVIMCILLALLFVFNLDPLSTLSTIQQIAKNQWGVVSIPETNVIRSLLWGLLLYYTIRYIQRNIYSERLTNYIHTIEENFQLNGDLPICREGGNYLQEYPPVLNLIHYIYTIIFPVLYL